MSKKIIFIYLTVCYNIYLLHFWYCMSKSDCVDLWEKENLFNRLNKYDSLSYEVVLALISVLSQWKICLTVWEKVNLGWLKQSKRKSIKLPIKVFYNSGLFYGGVNY